jgi:hypothetical protein
LLFRVTRSLANVCEISCTEKENSIINGIWVMTFLYVVLVVKEPNSELLRCVWCDQNGLALQSYLSTLWKLWVLISVSSCTKCRHITGCRPCQSQRQEPMLKQAWFRPASASHSAPQGTTQPTPFSPLIRHCRRRAVTGLDHTSRVHWFVG